MEVVIVDDEEAIGRLGADAVLAGSAARSDAVIGVATGSSPLPVYRALARRRTAGTMDLSAVRIVMLDEYLGLPTDHPQSYRRFVIENVAEPLGIASDRIFGPDPLTDDVERECAAYEETLDRVGGVDVQLLGIGSDGHIGFNEPSSSLASRTRIKTLTTRTRVDNARFFDDDVDAVPTHVITQGIGTILAARHLVLVASGAAKANAVAAAVEGPVSAMVPASAIQLHPHVTVIVDEDAAADLTLADYYRETFSRKPAWQGF